MEPITERSDIFVDASTKEVGGEKIKALWTKKMTSDIKWNLHKQVKRTRNDNREQKGKLCAGPSCLGVYLEDSDYMKEYSYMKS